MGDDFDILVTTTGPDGSVQETPMNSASPEARAHIGTQRARPLTNVDRRRLGIAQAQERAVETEENRSTIGAAAQLATETADTMSMGAISAFVPGAAEHLQAQREARPVQAGAAEAVGWILPALLSGGESGAAMALTPGGAAARVGMGVESLLGRALGTGVAGRTVGIAAGAAADGFISGAADAVRQSNLQGTPLEAEQILANAGLGAVMGGAGGLVLGAPMSMVERRLARAARVADEAVPPAPVRASNLETPTYEPGAPLRFERRQLRRADVPGAAFAGAVSDVGEDEIRILAAYADEAFDPIHFRARTSEAATSAQNALNAAEEAFSGAMVPERRLAAATRNMNVPAEWTVAEREAMRTNLATSIENAIDATTNSGLQAELQTMHGEILEASLDDHGLFAMNDRLLHRFAESDTIRSGIQTGAQPLLPAIYDTSVEVLRRLGDGGDRLADVHEALRAHWASRSATRDFADLSVSATTNRAEWRLHNDRLAAGFDQIAGEGVARDLSKELADMVTQTSDRIAAVDNLFGTQSPSHEAMFHAVERIKDAVELAEVRSIGFRAGLKESDRGGFFSAFGGGGSLVGSTLAGGAIGMLGAGPVGAAVGGALGLGSRMAFAAASHPTAVLKFFGQVSGAASQTQTRMATSLGRLRGVLRAGRGFGRALNRTQPKSVVALRSAKSRREEYGEIRDRVLELTSNPEAMQAALADSAGDLEKVSPVYSQVAMQSGMAGLYFLAERLPAADQPSVFSSFEDDEPSMTEMDSFLRFWESLEDPIGNIDRLTEGTLDVEHVEAMAAAYPELLREVQTQVTEIVSDLDTLPPYQQRMAMGVMLNIPIDRTLSAGFVHSMQQTFAQTSQQDQTQTQTVQRSVSMQLSDDTRTASQSIRQTLR